MAPCAPAGRGRRAWQRRCSAPYCGRAPSAATFSRCCGTNVKQAHAAGKRATRAGRGGSCGTIARACARPGAAMRADGHTSRGSRRAQATLDEALACMIGVHGRRIRLAARAQRHAADDGATTNHGAQRRRRTIARAGPSRGPPRNILTSRRPRRPPFPASRRPTRSSRRATAARKSKRARRARCTRRASSRRVGSSFGRRRTRARSRSRASTALARSSPVGIRAALG